MPQKSVLGVLVLIVGLSPILFTASLGAEADQVSESVLESYSVRMVQSSEPPVIDGKLDDAIWAEAAVFSNFTQVRPREGILPSEKTEVRLLQDADFLYIGIRAYDSEPDKIIAKEMQRDINLRSEDRIRFTIDTFHNLRSGYYFAMNARAVGERDRKGVHRARQVAADFESIDDGSQVGPAGSDERTWVVEGLQAGIGHGGASDQGAVQVENGARRGEGHGGLRRRPLPLERAAAGDQPRCRGKGIAAAHTNAGHVRIGGRVALIVAQGGNIDLTARADPWPEEGRDLVVGGDVHLRARKVVEPDVVEVALRSGGSGTVVAHDGQIGARSRDAGSQGRLSRVQDAVHVPGQCAGRVVVYEGHMDPPVGIRVGDQRVFPGGQLRERPANPESA